jgi:predicted RNase H-like nuclease (RuvC/YqgF family)
VVDDGIVVVTSEFQPLAFFALHESADPVRPCESGSRESVSSVVELRTPILRMGTRVRSADAETRRLASGLADMEHQCDALAIELHTVRADAELQLRVERVGLDGLSDALAAERQRVDELQERLDAIERTLSWRLRTAALPVLRPMAQAGRCTVRRWRALRSGH